MGREMWKMRLQHTITCGFECQRFVRRVLVPGNYLEIPWFYTMYYQRMVGYVIRGDIDR